MREWINAFRCHQIDTLEARSKFLEKKLEKVGVRVPRASVLITEGMDAPNIMSQATLDREALQPLGRGPVEQEKKVEAAEE